jgi:hypothetical protein
MRSKGWMRSVPRGWVGGVNFATLLNVYTFMAVKNPDVYWVWGWVTESRSGHRGGEKSVPCQESNPVVQLVESHVILWAAHNVFVVWHVSVANANVMSSVKTRCGFRRKWFWAPMLVLQQQCYMCCFSLHSFLLEETGLNTVLSVRTCLHILSLIQVLRKSNKEDKSWQWRQRKMKDRWS